MQHAVGCDHAGFFLKQRITSILLNELGQNVVDVGTYSLEPVDYPDYAEKVAYMIQQKLVDRGILVCGTGIGVTIVANKFQGIRAALCLNPEMVELARRHNDANIICMGGRLTPELDNEILRSMLELWIKIPFDGGRHQVRLEKIQKLEIRESSLRTTLGKRLLFLRNQAIQSGMKLLSVDEVLEEVRRRREGFESNWDDS